MKENKVICRSLSEDSDNRALWNGDIWDSSNDTSRLQIRYDLKSGKTVYRSYMVSIENQKNLYKEGYAEGTLKSERYSILKLDDKYVDEVRCYFITGESVSLSRTIRQRDSCWWMHFVRMRRRRIRKC